MKNPWKLAPRECFVSGSGRWRCRTVLWRLPCGARESVTAHGLHRPTQERPAAESPAAEPTQRWCSDCGKVRANVTGKSARTVGLHPSWALGFDSTEVAAEWSGMTSSGHPADLLETGA